MPLLEKYPDKIDWRMISENPSLFNYDYNTMKESNKDFYEETLKKVLHPERLSRIAENHNMDLEEYLDHI